ncbi:hypothetical protein E8E12_008038 [Didymella heteroderae]|uniref:Uncharacterized protein n=1 Tax=Didymella heteroderae TaxID=1769908 RepID=A0A9P5BZ90_9PLEO|nr:hypothetical protein E8E12_008038 [Didymella heteroderae]
MPSGFETRGPPVVRLSGGYEERAEAVLARLARPGQAGLQVSTRQDPLSECSVRLAKLEQRRIASMSEGDGARGPLQPVREACLTGRPLRAGAGAKAAGADASSGALAPVATQPLAAADVFWKEPLSTVPSFATLSQTVPSQSLLQTAPPASSIAARSARRFARMD